MGTTAGAAQGSAAEQVGQREGVVLLHGLARTRLSMARLGRFLRRQGYTVINASYPSRSHPVETLAGMVIPPALGRLQQQGVGRIHFVTHSMGGVLARTFLATKSLPELGRVVMLAPPNQGSELVDVFWRYGWFRWFFGPAAGQLSTATDSLPNRLGPATFPLGVIIGDRSAGWPFATCFPGPNDGKVTVARARLIGMDDFLAVPCGHAFVMNHPLVRQQVVWFLAHGRFRR